ncbi:hypothetical protein [Bradyrhizobium elkanii]|uniref:hypothetical protein n=1 Tax=Bradyrhizobium elkanii TaxID=29448 RepID=UPI0035158EA8
MDAAEAAGLVARAAVEMTGALTKNLIPSMSTGLSTGQGGENRALEKRRAWDRDRQKRRREAEKEAKRMSAMSTGHQPESTGLSTGRPVDNADVCLTVEVKKEGLSVGKERKKGSRLLVGTRVSDEQRAIAIECGCPPDRVEAVWTEFVDYWSDIPGQKGCKLTWTGTWRNRVKALFDRVGNGNGNSNPRADTATGRATAREAQHVAQMGGAALRYLQESKAARQVGDLAGGAGTAEIFDFGPRAENAR